MTDDGTLMMGLVCQPLNVILRFAVLVIVCLRASILFVAGSSFVWVSRGTSGRAWLWPEGNVNAGTSDLRV